MKRPAAVAAFLGCLLLVILHVDSWRQHRVAVYFGWLPDELAYRIVWMLLAWLFLLWFCAHAWNEEGE